MMKEKNLATVLLLTVLISVCGCLDHEAETPVLTTPTSMQTIHPISIPTPTREDKNIEIVTEVVEDYHKTHTYSEPDLFICADMAIDVWNMVETQEINAEIVVGNVGDPNADWTEYNHAWVLVETSPDAWLALETTGGYITYEDSYYTGYFFENPRRFKEYLKLMKEYGAQIDRINELQKEYSDTYDEWVGEANYHQELVDVYDSNYAGRLLSPEEYQASLNLQNKIYGQYAVMGRVSGRADQLVSTLNEENQRLVEITNEWGELLN